MLRSKEGSARAVCWREFGIACSYTLEASLGGADNPEPNQPSLATAAVLASQLPGWHFCPRDLQGIGSAVLATLPQLADIIADDEHLQEHLAALESGATVCEAGTDDDGGSSSSSSDVEDSVDSAPAPARRAQGRDVLRETAIGRRLARPLTPATRPATRGTGTLLAKAARPISALPSRRPGQVAEQHSSTTASGHARTPLFRAGASRASAELQSAAAAAEGAWERCIREMLMAASSSTASNGEFTPRTLSGLRMLAAGATNCSHTVSAPASPAIATAASSDLITEKSSRSASLSPVKRYFL